MKAKIKAQIIDKMKAKLVVVDDENTDIEGMDVEEITADWIRENLPAVAEELSGEGADAEQDRQEAIDDVDAGDHEEEDHKEAARKDRKVTADNLASTILKHRAAKASAAATDAKTGNVADVKAANAGALDKGKSDDDEAFLQAARDAGAESHSHGRTVKA